MLGKFVADKRALIAPVSGIEAVALSDTIGDRYTWRATTSSPEFALGVASLLPGWHMLEIGLSTDQLQALCRIHFDMFRECDNHSVMLLLRPSKLTKRVLYIPFGIKRVRIIPMHSSGHFSIDCLRLVWLTPWFARNRMFRRVINLSPHYIQLSEAAAAVQLKEEVKTLNLSVKQHLTALYNATFTHLCAKNAYQQWLVSRSTLNPEGGGLGECVAVSAPGPRFLLLLAVPQGQHEYLVQTLHSVLQQSYESWQLYVLVDSVVECRVLDLARATVADDDRVQLHVVRDSNFCAAFSEVIGKGDGDFVAWLGCDDLLARDALLRMAESIDKQPKVRLLYSDEDKLDAKGQRFDPHFKPDWNPDLLLSTNYINNFVMYERDRLLEVVGPGETGAASSYGLALRFSSGLPDQQILHIPCILYHQREGDVRAANGMSLSSAELTTLSDYVAELPWTALIKPGLVDNSFKVEWPIPSPAPLVSLLIPTRDGIDILKPCVDRLLQVTDYADFEVIVVDNQSSCSDTLAYLDGLKSDNRVRVLRWDHPFNYSALNNFAAQHANGSILGLINNDIEPINAGWLTEMVRHVCREKIGCVGAKLYYPDDTIQHAGVILGFSGVAGHAHKHFKRGADGYFGRLKLVQNLSAVTGACLLLRKSVFEQVGGLNEKRLAVTFNDVDLCLKVLDAGYRNLWTPYAELYHHESASRGEDNNPRKRMRFLSELDYMHKTWGDKVYSDPAYNKNLTLAYEDFSLRC